MASSRNLPWRYVMVVLLSIGLAIIYGLKVNLNVAIVSMVNHTALEATDEQTSAASTGETSVASTGDTSATSAKDTSTASAEVKPSSKQDGPFVWTKSMQGNILSSYFWGYLVAMFPGSQMAEIVSAKWVFFFAVSVNIICTLATPISCQVHYGLAFAMRVGEGLGGGVTFPTTHVLLAHWAPPAERSTMSSIAFSGTILGTVISNYLSGVLVIHMGWEWVFYVMGGLSIVWLILWVIFVTDKPGKLKFISQKELEYIETSLGVVEGQKKVKRKVPWVQILKSVPFWAILVAHTCSNWGFYMLLTNMPLFMSGILKFDIDQTATYSAIPYFVMWIFSIAVGKTLDSLRKKQKLTTTWARKIATLLASVPTMLCLVGLCIVGTEVVISVILLTVALTAMGAMYSGFMTNHIDVANNYAGTLMGMTNTFGTVPGIVGPIFVGAMTEKDPTINAWRVIFGVTCGFFLVEIIVYTIFGSGNEQPWNKIEQPTSTST